MDPADLLAVCREALLLAHKTLQRLGDIGLTEVHGAHVTDISTRGDLAVSAALTQYFSSRQLPAVLLSEESGRQVLHPQPRLTIAFDDIDGTDNYFRGRGLLPYCTVVTILDHPEPCFSHAAAAGIIEHNSGRLWLAARGQGCLADGVAACVSPRQHLDRRALLVVDHYSSANEIAAFQGLYGISWIKDFGASALHLAGVSSGLFDAYAGSAQKAHELAAGYLLIREAGGCVIDWNGNQLDQQPYVFEGRYPIVAAGTPALAEAVLGHLQAPAAPAEAAQQGDESP
jgi:myo-inositol-1(or 4)-monophosphatase